MRRGVLAARGRFILFTDADLCTPFETLDRMWPWLDREYDIVIGTRRHHDAHIIVPQPWIRAALGCVYIWLTNLLLTTSFSDTNCGFKIFRSRVAHHLFALQRQPDWCFDAEILFLARRLGYLIKEIPVVWRHHSGTKVKPWKDVCTSLLGLLCIRLRAWRQVYGTLLPMREIEQCAVSPHRCSPVSDSLA